MNEIEIKGKKFKEEEIIRYGTNHINKVKKILICVGIILLTFGIIGTISNIRSNSDISTIIIGIVVFAGVGTVLLVLAFIKRNPYDEGIKYLNKILPNNIGIDGKPVVILESNKSINMSINPKEVFYLNTDLKQFQIMLDNKYSKIYNSTDIREYEVKVDNEVIVNSNSVSSKGVGKAIAGGLLFGDVGLIAGAINSDSKTSTITSHKEIKHYQLVIKLNDIINPVFVLETTSLQNIEEIVTTLEIICCNKSEN